MTEDFTLRTETLPYPGLELATEPLAGELVEDEEALEDEEAVEQDAADDLEDDTEDEDDVEEGVDEEAETGA